MVICLVTPKITQLLALATTLEVSTENLVDVCSSSKIEDAVLENLKALANKCKLNYDWLIININLR